jgi:hypothetical protein
VKRAQLEAVRAASKREQAHRVLNARFGAAECFCVDCLADRVIIAAATPALLEIADAVQREPRRGATDFGDLG